MELSYQVVGHFIQQRVTVVQATRNKRLDYVLPTSAVSDRITGHTGLRRCNNVQQSIPQTEYTVYITQPRRCSQKLWFWLIRDRRKSALSKFFSGCALHFCQACRSVVALTAGPISPALSAADNAARQWCKQDQILKTKTKIKTTGSKQRHLTNLTFN